MNRLLLSTLIFACCSANAQVVVERMSLEDDAAPAPRQHQPLLVVTPWYPLYCIADELTDGAEDIRIEWSNPSYIPDMPPDAVITLGAWQGDDAFQQARGDNIRAVEIDATSARTGASPAVATLPEDATAPAPPLLWLSAENLVKMVSVVAADIARLSPSNEQPISERRQRMVAELNQLSREIGTAIGGLPAVEVIDETKRLKAFIQSYGLVPVHAGTPGIPVLQLGEGGVDTIVEAGTNQGWNDLISRQRNNLHGMVALLSGR